MDTPSPVPLRNPTLEAVLAANPADWDLRLRYADWLEEWAEVRYAHAQRWLARKQRHPVRYTLRDSGVEVTFFARAGAPSGAASHAPAVLPTMVFDRLLVRATRIDPAKGPPTPSGDEPVRAAGTADWVFFPSPQVAVEALAAAMAPGERGNPRAAAP